MILLKISLSKSLSLMRGSLLTAEGNHTGLALSPQENRGMNCCVKPVNPPQHIFLQNQVLRWTRAFIPIRQISEAAFPTCWRKFLSVCCTFAFYDNSCLFQRYNSYSENKYLYPFPCDSKPHLFIFNLL